MRLAIKKAGEGVLKGQRPFGACHWAKIGLIVCGTRIQDARSIGFSELGISNGIMKRLGKSPVKIRKDFLRKETLALFKAWMARPDKRAY